MTTDLGSCSTCAAPRPAGTAFCGQCGQPYDRALRATVSKRLTLKVALGRVLGSAVGGAIWWFLVVPKVIDDQLAWILTGTVLWYGGYVIGDAVARRAVAKR